MSDARSQPMRRGNSGRRGICSLAATGYKIALVDLMVPEMKRTAVEIHDAGCQVMMFEAQAALTTAALPRRITVAEMTIPLELPKDEAKALASMVHRLKLDDAAKFSNRTKYNDGRREQDVLWSAICMLERQLAEAGM